MSTSLTDENRITPHPFGAAISVTPTAGEFGVTAVQLPEEGWIEVVGTIDDGAWDFSVRVPVSVITGKDRFCWRHCCRTATTVWRTTSDTDDTDYIGFGHTVAGLLLVVSGTDGAIAAQVYV